MLITTNALYNPARCNICLLFLRRARYQKLKYIFQGNIDKQIQALDKGPAPARQTFSSEMVCNTNSGNLHPLQCICTSQVVTHKLPKYSTGFKWTKCTVSYQQCPRTRLRKKTSHCRKILINIILPQLNLKYLNIKSKCHRKSKC